jgi:hypothetical protein
MTPGLAQPRSKLPWLPYESLDRVIINSHNFTPAGPDFSVNGKMPAAVWCPSVDDAGNGTTTLNEEIAGADGTLNNFALTGSTSNWVADTDNGGVRCIASDGSNDYIQSPFLPDGTSQMSLSLWCKYSAASQFVGLWYWREGVYPFRLFAIGILADSAGNPGAKIFAQDNNSNTSMRFAITTANMNDNAWHHVVAVRATANLKLYIDGTLIATATGSMPDVTHSSNVFMCSRANTNTPVGHFAGRSDDFRFWHTPLDQSDVDYLYAGGFGRGRS